MFILLISLQQDTTVEVIAEGVASLQYSEDVARDRALKDALRNAVERAMGTFISSSTIVENYRLIEDRILSKSEGYVKSYRILSEEKKDGLYRIRILAQVSGGKLEEDLKGIRLISLQKGRPLIYVSSPRKKIRDFFADKLLSDGFSITTDSSNADLLLKLDYAEELEERNLGYEANLGIFHLYISAKIIDRSGETISAYTFDREFPNLNDRIRNAFLETAYRNIKGRLLSRWKESEIVRIEIRGAGFEDVGRIRDILRKNVRDLERIIVRNLTDDYALVEVISRDDAQAIADILKAQLKDAKIHLRGSHITISMEKKNQRLRRKGHSVKLKR